MVPKSVPAKEELEPADPLTEKIRDSILGVESLREERRPARRDLEKTLCPKDSIQGTRKSCTRVGADMSAARLCRRCCAFSARSDAGNADLITRPKKRTDTKSQAQLLLRDSDLRFRAFAAQAGICGTALRGGYVIQFGIMLQYRPRVDTCIMTKSFACHRLGLGRWREDKKYSST